MVTEDMIDGVMLTTTLEHSGLPIRVWFSGGAMGSQQVRVWIGEVEITDDLQLPVDYDRRRDVQFIPYPPLTLTSDWRQTLMLNLKLPSANFATHEPQPSARGTEA